MGQAGLSTPAAALQAPSTGPWRRLAGLLGALAFQRPCPACGAWAGPPGAGGLCPDCWGDMPWLAEHAQARRSLAPGGSLDAAGAGLAYHGGLRQALHAYKFEGRASFRRPLARLLAAAARRWRPGLPFDAAVAVPPSARSLKERGFDAAGDLAAGAARHLGLPLWKPLARASSVKRQSELDRPGRLANARGAFCPAPGARLKGARVLVLDDILTTGATLEDAARALKAAGAARVEGLALARSERVAAWP